MTARWSNRSSSILEEPPAHEPRKFYVDGGQVEIAAHLVYELDADGKQLRVVKYTDYTADKVRTLYPNAADLAGAVGRSCPARARSSRPWLNGASTSRNWPRPPANPDADPFDLLCHVAYQCPPAHPPGAG